jgi:hypothetical protein
MQEQEGINEGSAFVETVSFFDSRNRPVVPVTVRYRIKDLTNDRIVRDWTSIASAQEVTIEVTAGDNAIYCDDRSPPRRFQHQVIVVQANADTDGQFVDEIGYRIRNIRGFDS